MRQILLGMATIVLAASLGAASEISVETGNDFLRSCGSLTSRHLASSVQQLHHLFCLGYVGGFVEGMKITSPSQFCAHDPLLSFGQMGLVLLKWLKDHPAQLHKSSPHLMYLAFSEVFPCPKP